MVVLPFFHTKHDRGLREEGLVLAKVAGGVEAQRPPRRPPNGAQDVLEGVDGDLAGRRLGAVGQPHGDAAVVVGEGLKRLEAGAVPGGDAAGALEADAEALCGAAGGGVEDVTVLTQYYLISPG
ncbi:hypothetical protein Trco_000825 [Trichoderma cornu-damae]|uniref:Uncharacterized protein n=1 Tax=Trichoderma cornu-damae TaxID=654480 RepID=A0A9P8QR23_9HYPO|nr:hypothetical protein Trco_000825 [Trichoderma cornu-damae]